MNAPAGEELFPEGFRNPSSVLISGSSGSLLKWVAFASLARYSSRVYWTDLRLPGEVLEPLDPMALHVIPEEVVHVLRPRDLQPEEREARLAEAASTTMFPSDEAPESVRRIIESLRMPSHTQERISATFRSGEPAILVCANAHRLVGVFPEEGAAPLIRSIVDAGACIVGLWADAVCSFESVFDVVVHVEGGGPTAWRDATIQCEKGISTGPLTSGRAHRLADVRPIATILEGSIPAPP
ncbi:MAG TPA: hypothetical protein VGG32_11070 [Thermoplasmata archaeon]|jgi:hypothetical protein